MVILVLIGSAKLIHKNLGEDFNNTRPTRFLICYHSEYNAKKSNQYMNRAATVFQDVRKLSSGTDVFPQCEIVSIYFIIEST